jgi:ATP-binding cassette subfamily B protein
MPPSPREQVYSATPSEVLWFLWKATKKHRWFFALMFVVVVLASVCSILVPVEMGHLVDVITQQNPSPVAFRLLTGSILLIIVYKLLFGLFFRVSGYSSAHMVPRIMAELEETALKGILVHSHSFFNDTHSGSLVQRVTRLSQAYSRVHSTFYWNMLGAAVVAFGVIIQLLRTKPAAAVILALWLVVLVILNLIIARWKTPIDQARNRAQSSAVGLLADVISNASVVKSFAHETRESASFQESLRERVRCEKVAWLRSEHGLTISDFMGALMHGGVLFLLLWLWEAGRVTVTDFVVLQSFVVLVTERLFSIGFAYRDFVEALANASEIVGILKAPIGIQDTAGAEPLRITKGQVSFSRVSFKYEKHQVIKNLTFEVQPQEKVALVGPSGAGKSTVIKLLLRFYDATKGRIFIDGQDIAHVTQESLRAQISLVPQEPLLFHRSLRENLAYGCEGATMKQIIQAAKQAHCHEFINQLPAGYETLVGERGVKLSGGERQRVAIARAILANTPIIILDEATSALDSESETLIQQALTELMKSKTVIVIAHRLSTVMNMDRIIVMENGEMIDSGTHEELLKKRGTYQKLWNIQVGGYEGRG